MNFFVVTDEKLARLQHKKLARLHDDLEEAILLQLTIYGKNTDTLGYLMSSDSSGDDDLHKFYSSEAIQC